MAKIKVMYSVHHLPASCSALRGLGKAVKCVKSLNLKHKGVVSVGLGEGGGVHKKQQGAREIRAGLDTQTWACVISSAVSQERGGEPLGGCAWRSNTHCDPVTFCHP